MTLLQKISLPAGSLVEYGRKEGKKGGVEEGWSNQSEVALESSLERRQSTFVFVSGSDAITPCLILPSTTSLSASLFSGLSGAVRPL